jgi:hypothetical protein
MNPLIKQLAVEAGLLGRKFMFGQYYDDELSDEQKKFVELIVGQCADYVDFAVSNGGIDGHDLKNHFGVEK